MKKYWQYIENIDKLSRSKFKSNRFIHKKIAAFMVTQTMQSEIEKFVKEVAEKFKPEKIILFGSHALDQASPGSDVDLLGIMEFKGRPQLQALNIRRQID